MTESGEQDKVRIDKWLWAARFFKTRSQATQAVIGGKVHVDGERVKPARLVKVGDEIRIQRGEEQFVVQLLGVAERRGPAPVARLLYTETEASIEARQQADLERRLRAHDIGPLKRPSKGDRRKIVKFTRKYDET
jgi:ribosome-associated heat shock protein Hsp15